MLFSRQEDASLCHTHNFRLSCLMKDLPSFPLRVQKLSQQLKGLPCHLSTFPFFKSRLFFQTPSWASSGPTLYGRGDTADPERFSHCTKGSVFPFFPLSGIIKKMYFWLINPTFDSPPVGDLLQEILFVSGFCCFLPGNPHNPIKSRFSSFPFKSLCFLQGRPAGFYTGGSHPRALTPFYFS